MSKYFFAIIAAALMMSCAKESKVVVVSLGDYEIEGVTEKPVKHDYLAPYNKDEYVLSKDEIKIKDKTFKIEGEGSFVVNNTENDLLVSSLDAPSEKVKEALSAVANANSLERAFQEIQLNNTGQEDVKLIERIPPFSAGKVTKNKNSRIYGPRSQPPRRIDLKEGEAKPLLFQMFDVDEVKKSFKTDLPK